MRGRHAYRARAGTQGIAGYTERSNKTGAEQCAPKMSEATTTTRREERKV